MSRSALVSILSALILGSIGALSPARATSLIVPDQSPTIQAAIDAVVDTIIIRPGAYPETLIIREQFSLMTASEDPGGPPEIGGLDFTGAGNQIYEFHGLEFMSNILVTGPFRLKFVDCVMSRINVQVVSSWLLRCRISEYSGTDAVESATVDSCELHGISSEAAATFVRGCTIDGPGYGVSAQSGAAYIEGNLIRGTVTGVGLDNCDSTFISHNRIEDCQRYGIYDSSNYEKSITNNIVLRCVEGLQFENGDILLADNFVSGSNYSGIAILSPGSLEAVRNVVCGSRFHGIRVSGAAALKVNHNTVALNGYNGIQVDESADGDECIGNIGYDNGIWGVAWEVFPGARFECNDWFANGFGAASDRDLFETEFSVDPKFCNPDSGDFHLQVDSPVADWPGCGLVGALGIGCGATATTVQRFTAERTTDAIRVVWQIAQGSTLVEAWLERSDEVGPWLRPVTARHADAGLVVELDRNTFPDHAYRYRLVAREGTEVMAIGAEISVHAVEEADFQLRAVGPSPAAGPVQISFSLAHAAPIQIDVFDLQGRCIASPARGTWPVGVHEVEWGGSTRTGNRALPGLYMVRYTFPGGQRTHRLIRIS